ncbi:MAG: DUF3048 domain-containing protein [Anaerolineae bacterium]|jgi:hypothetical protein|nr:DUF3048 domain-containing protein [Anaerolineae bacterium]
MQRLLPLFICVVLALVALTLLPPEPARGQFATNTPAGSSGIQPNPALPTSAGGGGFFSTNTPDGPTATPTATATATWTPTPTATNTPTPTPTPLGPFSYPDNVNSLTGLEYVDQTSRERVNLIVKISNYPPVVRPQTGINLADVVYEYEAEGGVTRFAAIFRSQTPPLVGSIRSGRLMDMELMTMYRGNLVYSGTSEPIQRLFLQNYPFRLISPFIGDPQGETCQASPFCRLPREGLAFEHTMFGNPQLMWDIATQRGTNRGFKARGFAFSAAVDATSGTPANDVFIDWYGQTDARWQYDPASSRWLRYTDGVAHFDRGDGQQIWADNVVVIVAVHERRPDLFPEGANYESLQVRLWREPEENFLYQALLFRDGRVYEGFWDRPNRDEGTALFLVYGNNEPMKLKPGRTWVSVVRGLGDVVWNEQKADLNATATLVALTPSPTPLNINEGD